MNRFAQLILSVVLCFSLTSCAEGAPATPTSESTNNPTEEVSSEKAMENFLAKVDACNYTVDAKDHLKISVFSKDQVNFEYADDMYNDFTVMSVDNETFQAFLTEDGLEDVSFIDEGHAVDAAKSRLLNYWMDESVSEGNIWNLFYNDQDEPLKFVSYEDVVKQTVMSFMGYGDNVLRLMHEVYMILDAEDPALVHLQAEVDDDVVARIFPDDIDVTVTFGDAESNSLAEKWMSNPVYPEGRTEWTEGDIFILNSVFLPGYGKDALPFPSFASYAFKIDEENFVFNDEVSIRDSRASEKDMQEYIAELLKNNFTEVKDKDADGVEKTYYRRLLRDEYDCYTSVNLEYDNGVNMVANKYYEFPVYENQDEINKVIQAHGYLPLPASANIKSLYARDSANQLTESWLYFFNYDLLLYADVDYENYEELLDYLNEYGDALVNAGFHPVYTDETEQEIDRYESEDEFCSFRYHVEDDVVTLLFKSEKYISADEAEKMIQDAGFPAIDLKDYTSCRDLKKFEKVQYGKDFKTYLTLSQSYDTVQEAEDFLSAYEAVLEDAGFGRTNPANVSTNKQIAIYNEDKGMLVGVDFTEQNGGALINFEFSAE